MAMDYLKMLGLGGNPMLSNQQMMGLLGVDPRRSLQRGLLAAAAPLLEAGAGGSRPSDASLGRALGRAGMAGMKAYDDTQTLGMARGLGRLKFANQIADLEQKRMRRNFAQEMLAGGDPQPQMPQAMVEPETGFAASDWLAANEMPPQPTPVQTQPGLSRQNRQEVASVALSEGIGDALERRRQILKDARTDFNKDYDRFGRLTPGGSRKLERTYRTDFNKDPSIQTFKQARSQWSSAVNAAQQNTRAADVSLVYAIAKIYDPTSVVREGEYNMVIKNTNALPAMLVNYIKSVTEGKSALSAKAKQDLISAAAGRMEGYRNNTKYLRDQVGYFADRDKLDIQGIYNVGEFQESYDPSQLTFKDTTAGATDFNKVRINTENLSTTSDTQLSRLFRRMQKDPNRYSPFEINAVGEEIKKRGL